MIFVYIYLGISLMCLLMYTLASVEIANKFKIKYGDVRFPKKTFAGTLFSWVKLAAACFVPIIHICLFWTIVFNYSEVEERSIKKLYREYLRLNAKE